ncbi:MAG: ABC transporter permease [Lachnospiraceae bacterium]|nr:ABC transporter permease [Lachnospiraceae bacterium]
MSKEITNKAEATRQETRRNSMTREVVIRLMRNKSAILGLVMMVVIITLCLLAPLIAPYDYAAQDVTQKFQSPSLAHLMGTDNLGRDIFSRILYGGRISLFVGLSATAITVFFGTILGAIAGYYGGRTDNIIMRILDVFMAMPGLLLAIAVASAIGAGMNAAIFSVGVGGVANFARVVRGPIMQLKDQEYIEAAKSIDASDRRIIARHVLPNVLSPIICSLTGCVASNIISCATLSFLGLGVQAPIPEWGAMLSQARTYILQYGYMVMFPGLALMLLVISLNLFGDGLRDAMDPRLKD